MSEQTGYVVDTATLPARTLPSSGAMMRVAIDRAVGCQNLEQRILRYGPSRATTPAAPGSEDVLYAVAGQGHIIIGEDTYDLAPGTGALVPPGVAYTVDNNGPDDVLLVSVLSPQPERPAPPPGPRPVAPLGRLTVVEAGQEALPAGDRRFKLLVDPRMGCHNVTQFVGFIPPGRAPFHTHTYEEVIYIVAGEGIAHVQDRDLPVRAGSSVYLPPLLEHCIENTGDGPLRLLGVFCPAGDPSSKASESNRA